MANVGLILALVPVVGANDNGLAHLPPMGWRSWNLYGRNVNQALIEGIMDGMVSKARTVDGEPTSLCDLGYCDVGLDDNWQDCNGGEDGNHYHKSDGTPAMNYDRFPDMKAMVDHAHELGLTSGWYGNNCICSDHNSSDRKFYEGDAKLLREFGFDGYKLDGCGSQTDMQLWDDVFKADGGPPVMVENCHWGRKVPYEPNKTWCPWNFYRTSGDVRAKYSSVIGNLNSVSKFNSRNLSTPGCWAYPDMLEVGCEHGPGGSRDSGLSMAETRSHFGAWVIVSSPLTLSHDVNNDTIMDQIWPIIANKEAIAVSQTYAGFSGGKFLSSSLSVTLDEVNHAEMERSMTDAERKQTGPTVSASFQYLYKPLDYAGTKAAVLLMNSDNATQNLTLSFADVPGLKGPCKVRDIWDHKDLGGADESMTFAVDSHDAAFLVLSECKSAPTPPPPTTSRVVNPSSNKCLDIYGGKTSPVYPANEATAQLYKCNGGSNQEWVLQGTALVNPSSGKCLDINNKGNLSPDKIADNRKVELYTCNGRWNQQWELRNGQIVNTPSGKCLDIDEIAYPNNEAKVQLLECADASTAKQTWEMRPVSIVV